MKLLRILLSFLPLLVLAVAAAQTPPTTNPHSSSAEDQKKCSIEGKVVEDAGGQPLRKAKIELRNRDQFDATGYEVATDDNGSFKLENIQPGRYGLSVERTGFWEVLKHRHSPRQHLLTLTPGQEMKGLVFRMRPFAVITGKVLDNDGDPLQGANVVATVYGASSSQLSFVGTASTNDLGEFRISNLRPGKYLVCARVRNSFSGMREETSEGKRAPLPYPTCYPGTSDKSQAVPIELHAGDEMPADITMASGPAFNVSGEIEHVSNPTGTPVIIMLQEQDGFPWMFSGAESELKKDGSFEIRDLIPGDYSVMIMTTGPNSIVTQAAETIEVKDTDLQALQLTPEQDTELTGQLRAADGQKLDWSRFYLSLNSDHDDAGVRMMWANGPNTHGQISKDGSFDMKKVPPGHYRVQVFPPNSAEGAYFLKSVELEGTEVSDSGFTANGGSLSLNVTLSSDSGTIEGVVVDRKDEPLPDAIAIAVPDTEHQHRPDLFHQAGTDQNGRFTMYGLRPGEYTLIALDDLDNHRYYDAEFLKWYENSGKKVKVEGRESKSVLLHVIEQKAPDQP